MFQPMIIGTGLVAWRNLQRSLPQQKENYSETAEQRRLVTHFRENAAGVRSAENIVSDRQLRQVALTAFGLQDDIDNTYFIKRILDEGTAQSSALANKLSDSRYSRMAAQFAFDGLTPITGLSSSTVEDVVAEYSDHAFELSLEESAPDLRLALNAEREIKRIGSSGISEDAKWYSIMGSSPLRSVFESALGLPSSFGTLDLDQQLGVFKEQSERAFGTSSITVLAQEDATATLVDRFLLKEQLGQGNALSSMSIALQLLGA